MLFCEVNIIEYILFNLSIFGKLKIHVLKIKNRSFNTYHENWNFMDN